MPYSFSGIIPEPEGGYKTEHIATKDDIWNYILRLWDESEEFNKGNGQSTLLAVFEQLPFFCSLNNLLDQRCQKDIEKYLYCNETSTPAYSGTYQDTPEIWIQKYYTIKRALAIKEKILRDKLQEAKNGN